MLSYYQSVDIKSAGAC